MADRYKVILIRDGIRKEVTLHKHVSDETSFRRAAEELCRDETDCTVCAELYDENYTYALYREAGSDVFREMTYYNDFDDYEYEIETGSERWLAMFGGRTV